MEPINGGVSHVNKLGRKEKFVTINAVEVAI
jgi:hypothetical protein